MNGRQANEEYERLERVKDTLVFALKENMEVVRKLKDLAPRNLLLDVGAALCRGEDALAKAVGLDGGGL